MEKEEFARRLVALRQSKNVSARDMSLSIGQSPGYINNIENGINFPSMSTFFYICEYLGVTPKEFFDTDVVAPTKTKELLDAASRLTDEQLEHLIAIVKDLR
jgi:transcriptional regulator with XRE-family HTH domain